MNATSVSGASWVGLIIAIAVTIYVASAKNPFEKGTDDYQSLRLCRIGLAFLVWSFDIGPVGIAFALTSFIFGIIGIVKGRTIYGVMLLVVSACSPIINFMCFLPH